MNKRNNKRSKIKQKKLLRKAKRKFIKKVITKKDFRKKGIYKHYFDAINSKDKKYIYKLFGNQSYNLELFKYLIVNSKLHSLDLLTFLKTTLVNEDEYMEGDFLSPLKDERLRTPKGNLLNKRYLGYILEWHILFSSGIQPLDLGKNFNKQKIANFKNGLDVFLVEGIYDTIYGKDMYLPNTGIKLNSSIFKDRFYNDVFISGYHQEATQYSLFSRILFIFKKLEDYLSNIDVAKKYFVILVFLVYYSNSRKTFIIDINVLVKEFLPKTNITKKDILNFFDFIGVTNYAEYLKNIREKGVEEYFPNSKSYNFINIELEIHKTPFIDISHEWGQEGKYIFDETYLLKKFYTNLDTFTANITSKKRPRKLSFGELIEIYIDKFTSEWLEYKGMSDKYIIMQGVEFKSPNGEIDLIIYNNETKNLLIFEAKDNISLNEKLFKSGKIENLTKISERFTNGKSRNAPGEIYHGINQLFKHSKRGTSEIAKKLGVDSINNIKYIFLNHHNSMFWNEIMRYFIDKNKEFKGFEYQFMNLYEFEKIISLGCKKDLDFYDLIKNKEIPIINKTGYRSILERFKACNKSEGFKTENIDGINQDFNVFLGMKYGYWGEEIVPFIDNEIFAEFFND